MAIAARVADEGRALVILHNKWDWCDTAPRPRRRFRTGWRPRLAQVKGVPVVTCSGLSGKGTEAIMPAVLAAFDTWNPPRAHRRAQPLAGRGSRPIIHRRSRPAGG